MSRSLARILSLAAALVFMGAAAQPALAACPSGCDDGNPCTDDTCDPQLGCVHANNTLPCTDGNACTTNDACNGGVCVGGDTAPGCAACSSVANLPAAGAVVRGHTSGTSSLSGSCGIPNNNAPERVFKWTPTASGLATFKTCSPNTLFDSVIYVRKTSCTGAQQVCNDDGPCGFGTTGSEASNATLSVTAGTPYYIVVDGYNGGSGAFELTVQPPTVCGNNVREGAEECDGTDVSGCVSGQCTSSCTCVPPQTGLPDLSVEITDWFLDYDATVDPGDYAEGCAEALSGVDLLHLGVRTTNVGTADFYIGPTGCPAPCTAHPLEVCGNPSFICSPAAGHNHGHYTNYARYDLLDAQNQSIVVGHKQGFCLKDGFDAGPCSTYKFDCNNQGISMGCADLYESTLGCQYLDITGIPAGNYTLRATVDPFDTINELSNANNQVTVPVTIPVHACTNPTVVPPGGGSFTDTTSGISTLTGTCGGTTNTSPEKVFSWTPNATGMATIDTCSATGTAFDTVLYVRGTACRSGTELTCNNDTTGCNTAVGENGSRVALNVTAGQTYYLVVDGIGAAAGSFKLNVTPPAGAPQCSNGIDDDGDGLIDLDDQGCRSANDPSERGDCSDGIDNDGDGLTDFPADPGCASNLEVAIENPQCNDGLDNDGDGLIDFPADTGCHSAAGPTEKAGSACGLVGVESLLPAGIALALRRRRMARAGRTS